VFSFERDGDRIFVKKPNLLINNVILGTLSFDMTGEIQAKNETFGDTATIQLIPRSWSSQSRI